MSATQGKITLSKTDGSQFIIEATDTIIAASNGYITATVEGGSWIIYHTEPKYGIDSKYALMLTKEQQYAQLPKPINFVRLVEYKENGICLFGDHHYLGPYFTYTPSINESFDVTAHFPVGQKTGVSSLIIFGETSWKLYYVQNGKTQEKIVKGPAYHDTLHSIPGDVIKDDQIFKVERLS